MIEEKDSEKETGGEEDFAAMLEQSMMKREKRAPGQAVDTRIVSISSEWIFLDLGGKGEGYLDKKEFTNEQGEVTVKVGDTIRAYFVSTQNNELLFTTKVGAGPGGRSQLEDAWRNGISVEGTVAKEVKGGFEVKIAGNVRAFCPFSQTGLGREEKQTDFVGKTLAFRIAEYAENGRNIVLSRRVLLDEERKKARLALRDTLKEGMRVRGRVTSLQKFGAFVNIGAIEGLIPISEAAWSRTEKISDLLSMGQEVEVIIKRIDWDKERISLSLKDTLQDPWENVAAAYPAGSYHPGKVARLTPFGAFVTLADGVDGLIHISKLGAGKRISHPKEVLKEGQSVEVKIESVDRDNRKISLSLAAISREEDEAAETLKEYKQREAGEPQGMGTLGDLLKAKMDQKKN
ncbi:MAG: 30S ribosomal protein S1 [Nitrospiraceae bacterium]|nr:30S ribosomal protein S1 [Nitrospiraceae bacterium]